MNTDFLVTHGIYAAGIVLLAWWLLTTSLGRKALANAPPRRNRTPIIAPLIPLSIWFIGTALMQSIVEKIVRPPEEWQRLFLNNLVYSAMALFTVGVMLFLAEKTFARGLRGLGLWPWTIPKDLGFAFVDLLAVWPVFTAVGVLTIEAAKALVGPQFEMPKHVGLEIITESTALPLRVLIIVLAVGVAPLVEETLFRGLIQTVLRSHFGGPWPAIFTTAALFAFFHVDFQNPATVTHVPPLFALAVGLGYAYEKSGSLFRSIFMHAMFNAVSILAALSQTARP
jgi:membrane protease YdiL (CAAX protease family)